MRTMTISISLKQASRIQQAVETGAYASNSEVVRDAMRLWERREELRSIEMSSLKQAYDEGVASGSGRPVDADSLLVQFKAKASGRG